MGFPMVMLLLVSTVLLMLELFTLPRDLLTLMLSMDTEDTEDMATWVMLDTVVQLHMLTLLDPTSLMLSSMFPMVMLLLVSTALLTLELSMDTEDTEDMATWVMLDTVVQ